jgi:ribonucleotide monophosphatase NagD (HAD superfamily)
LQSILSLDADTAPRSEEIYSSSNSTRDFFHRLFRHELDGSCYIVGENGLVENIREAYKKGAKRGCVYTGSDVVDVASSDISYVVVGCVHQENTRNSERACDFVRKGARLLYSCPDMFDRDPQGRCVFGMAMPLVNLIQTICTCEGYNLGKPNPHMLRMGCKMLLAHRHDLAWCATCLLDVGR